MNVPRGVEPFVLTVIVELPGGTTDDGEKVALAPAGSPLTLSVTELEKPPCEETVAVYDVVAPRLTVRDEGLTESEKSGGGLMTRVTEAVCERVPLAPAIVSG